MNLSNIVLVTRSIVKKQTFTEGFWNWITHISELRHPGDFIDSEKRDTKYSWNKVKSLLLKISPMVVI